MSTGETRVTSPTGGQKGTKLARFDLIPAGPLWQVAELYGRGAVKYDDHNWRKGFAWSLSFAAMQRHAWQFWSGQDTDPETGSPHLASVIFHAMALLQFAEQHPDFDDRPRPIMTEDEMAEQAAAYGPDNDGRSIWGHRRAEGLS